METIKITAEKAMYAFCAITCDCARANRCVSGQCAPCHEAQRFLVQLYKNREKED